MYSTAFIISFKKPENNTVLPENEINDLYEERPNKIIDCFSSENIDTKQQFQQLSEIFLQEEFKDLIIIDKQEMSIEFKEGFAEKWFGKKLHILKALVDQTTPYKFFDTVGYKKIKYLVYQDDGYWFKDYTNNDWGCWYNLDDLIRETILWHENKKIWILQACEYHI